MPEGENEPLVKDKPAQDDKDLETGELDDEPKKGWFAGCCRGCLPSQYMRLNESKKMEEYDHESNLRWQALLMTTGTIFFHRRVWVVIPYVLLVTTIFACLIYFGVPHAQRLDTRKFNDFVTYIKIFIAFMLGLFLSTSFNRWWSSVSSFKKFLTAIKQLMYSLHAIGVKDELFDEVKRLCIASCFVLNTEVHVEQCNLETQRDELFQESIGTLETHGFLTPAERQELDKYGQLSLGISSTIIWTWIGEEMTRVRFEPTNTGDKPPPPMYVRLLFLCHDCMNQVEVLKTNLTVQVPFSYAHMLAWMIHLANVLLAISCGLAIGSAMDEIVTRQAQLDGTLEPGGRAAPTKLVKEFYGAIQVCGMQVLLVVVQPLIYQSFLVIAHSLCYPFGDGLGKMPTESFIQQMQFELEVIEVSKGHQHAPERRRQSVLHATQKLGLLGMVGKKKDNDEDDEDDDDG